MNRLMDPKPVRRIRERLARLYGGDRADALLQRFLHLPGRYGVARDPLVEEGPPVRWNENDVLLITYADMVSKEDEAPLATLRRFCLRHLREGITAIHLLPFFPWTSDDGFSVVDYREVDPAVGTWGDVRTLGNYFKLMFDLVLNHASVSSAWFEDFVAGVYPAADYIMTAAPEDDLTAVVRPRTSPLLTRFETRAGERWVWTTFSPDQADLDWRNPDLLFEFLDILMLYLSMGMNLVRLDAVAFLWKEIGTSCLHLPQTHEVVKLLRDVLEILAPETVLLTETNVPHRENLSYFGDGDEANMVYQFSLPPLLLHGLLREDASVLTTWAADLPDPGPGQTFLNFTASHDGIGVRPLQGLVPEGDLDWLLGEMESRGGLVNWKTNPDGSRSPYELNITYASALAEPGDEALGRARFLLSQMVALSLRGLPAVYFQSLLGAPNDVEGVRRTGQNRSINRRKWTEEELARALGEGGEFRATFDALQALLRRRRGHPAFHPDGGQAVHDCGPEFLVLDRRAPDGTERILCLHNFTRRTLVFRGFGRIPGLGGAEFTNLNTGKVVNPSRRGTQLRPFEGIWLQVRETEAQG